MKTLSSKKIAELAIEALLSKKAEDVVILDIRGLSDIADYFVIASGSSVKRIDSIADNVEFVLKSAGCKSFRREGKADSLWVVLDFNDCIVHIFYKETRKFYNLERLWRDAKIVEFNGEKPLGISVKRGSKKGRKTIAPRNNKRIKN